MLPQAERPIFTRRRMLHLLAAASCLTGAQQQVMAQDRAPVVKAIYADSVEGTRPTPKIAKGSPNIIWILLDDAGFGASSTFGGLIATPTFDRLANDGLRYSNFHNTGVCSPTRAALLTGRNHNRVGMGMFPDNGMFAEFPGYSGRMPAEAGTVAQYLREAGYSTYQLGKWHMTPDEEKSDLGPFDHWPSGKGFDHNFGILDGATDQYKIDLVDDNHHVKPDGRHFNAQITDRAIAYVDAQQRLNPDKPFFMYYATGATHSPHQVEQPWIDKYKGKFDAGWDVFREQVFARQKKMGLIPANTRLPARDPLVPAWSTLTPEQKRISTRFMEAYAGFLEYTDFEIGRLVDHLRDKGLTDKTAIFVMIGDNGASKEGSQNGTIYSEATFKNVDPKIQIADLKARFDTIGTKNAYSNYPIGWAQAAATPFRKWKASADVEGGTNNPLIISWPGHVKPGLRMQYGHVIDLLPTALEMAGVQAPGTLKGIAQDQVQGTSIAYTFDNAKAPGRHGVQYYYLMGAGGIEKDGWKASFGYNPDFYDIFMAYPPVKDLPDNSGKEVWHLYNRNVDFNELNDLATKYPDKLKELQAAFRVEAEANHVYPLINWTDIMSFGKRKDRSVRFLIDESHR